MRELVFGALVLSVIVCSGCAHPGPKVNTDEPFDDGGWTIPIHALGISGQMEPLARPHNFAVKKVSSYDREGGSRDDAYAVEVYQDETVLADLEGPGCVLRIWVQNPWGLLYIYVDDMEYPLIVAPFDEIFTGALELHSDTTGLFHPPLTGAQGGGHFSYVPIPYKERCQIVAVGEPRNLTYEVDYAEFSPDTPIRSFSFELSGGDKKYFRDWRDSWQRASEIRFVDREVETIRRSSRSLWPDKNVLILPLDGPGMLTEIEMTAESVDPEYLEKTWIAIYFDGQTTPGVLAPLSQFFGTTLRHSGNLGGLAVGRNEDRMWCRYPMPYSNHLEVRMISTSNQIVDIRYVFTWQEGPVDDLLYFHARYNESEVEVGKPYLAGSFAGSGHFAGMNLVVEGAPSLSFLEGDPMVIIDGDSHVYHGTGTDDYFNSSDYFSGGPFSTPTHACTKKVGNAPTSVGAFRSHITDPVPFDRSMSILLEHGEGNDQAGATYSSVVYWYQREREPKYWPIQGLDRFGIDRSGEM